jgi:hypothetical protein
MKALLPRILELWADPWDRAGLRMAFAHCDKEGIWDALVTAMDLFGDVSVRRGR